MTSRRVDLPQPLGPTRHTNSPACTLKLTSSKAWTTASRVRNHFEICSTTSSPRAARCCMGPAELRLLDQAREIRCRAQEAGLLRLFDEALQHIARDLRREH